MAGALAFGPLNNDGARESRSSSGKSTCGGDGTLCWIGLPIDGDFSAYTKGSKRCMIEHKNDCRFKNKDVVGQYRQGSAAGVGQYLQKCQKCACQHGPYSQEFKDAECDKPIPEKMGGPKNKGCERVDVRQRLPLNGDWDGDWDCKTLRELDGEKRFRGDACSKMKNARKMFASGRWDKYLKKCQRCVCLPNKKKGKKDFELGQCNKPVTC